MKRLRVILLFLVLGAIVNVAVAWLLMGVATEIAKPEFIRKGINSESFPTTWSWSIMRWKCPGSVMLAAGLNALDESTEALNTDDSRIPHWSRMHELPSVQSGRWFMKHDLAAGWPLLSMYLYQDMEMDPVTAKPLSQVVHGGVTDFQFPYYVIPEGFIVDTMFYALMLWGPFGIYYACRHVFRRKRGLCVKCAYDLRGADHLQCPECGRR